MSGMGAPGGAGTYLDADGEVRIVPLSEHYRLRGPELQRFSPREYRSCVKVVQKSADEVAMFQARLAECLRADLPPLRRQLRSYERLRNGLNNRIAVVAMDKKGSCLGMMLPPQTQIEVRKKHKIIIDEHSGRIVVDSTLFDEAEKHFKN